MAKSFLAAFKPPTQVEPFETATSVNAWFKALPANHAPIDRAMAITALLEETYAKRPPVTLERTLALLELDRLSLPLQSQLLAQNRLPRISAAVRENLLNAHASLVRWFAYAYEQTCKGDDEPAVGQATGHPHGFFSRLFRYQGLHAQSALLRYEQWIPSRWTFLHAAYQAACASNVATVPFPFASDAQSAERCSAEHEYLQLLLLQRINTGNLSPPQIGLSAEWLRAMVPSLTLADTPPSGDGYWALDLTKPQGLLPAPAAELPGEVLYLDIAPLRTAFDALIQSMTEHLAKSSEAGDRIETRERLALARRLRRLVLPNAPPQPRRGERVADKRPVLVASGWMEIPILMRNMRPWQPTEPFKYTYGDNTGAAATISKGRRMEAPVDALPHDRRGWELLDTSESGYRIQSRTRSGALLQVGALIALLPHEENGKRVGIVRRLKRRTADHTEVGVEIISDNAQLMTVEPLEAEVTVFPAAKTARSFTAIYAPPQQRAQTAPMHCLVLPTAEFRQGRLLSLKGSGPVNKARLAVLIEYTKDWVWATLEVDETWRESGRI